jgi:hypothetical protein
MDNPDEPLCQFCHRPVLSTHAKVAAHYGVAHSACYWDAVKRLPRKPAS